MTAPRDGYSPWNAEDEAMLRRLWCQDRKSAREISVALGRSIASINNKIQRAGWTEADRTPATDDVTDAAVYGDAPLSVEDVIAQWHIDTTVFEAVEVVPNVWQMGAKHPVTGKILTQDLYQTKVRFRRKPNATTEQLVARLIADMQRESARRPRLRPRYPAPDGKELCALEVDVFDLHIGKYAWADETGTDYDSEIAERIASAAVSDLLRQVPSSCHIEEVVLPLGNDFFHYDNPQGQTTGGTPMDRDTRFQKMFRTGRALAAWMIETCAAIAPVRVIVVPGNHDTTTAFTMGVVLEADFAHDPRVSFDNSPKPRKYHRYGKTLLGYNHGHETPPERLVGLMPVDEPELWAQTTCREIHIGHFHTGKVRAPLYVEDKIGITVRWMRSLSGTDAWHAGKGFVGMRSAEAFLWRKAGGMRGHYVSLPVDDLLAAYTIKAAS